MNTISEDEIDRQGMDPQVAAYDDFFGHARPADRTATVRNLDPWDAAFDAGPERKLYLALDNRVRVW